MQNPEFKRQVGERVAAVLKERGISKCDAAQMMGYGRRSAAVTRLTQGQSLPEGDRLTRLERHLDLPEGYFLYGDALRGGDREFVQRLLDVVDLVAALGRSVPQATDRITGDPDLQTEAERRRLAAATPAFREGIELLAGKAWDLLSEAEKREVIDMILARLRGAGPA